MTLLYKYRKATNSVRDTSEIRCPICKFPMHNGFQLFCEPGVCMYRDVPVHYATKHKRQVAA